MAPRDTQIGLCALYSCQKFLFFVLLSLFVLRSADAQQFAFQHYGQEEGLRNLDVFQMIQDRNGFLWICTENGLFRYDGSTFHRFRASDGIDESMVLSLTQDVSGTVWATTSDHLYYFSGARFHVVPNPAGVIQFGVGQRLTSMDAQHILLLNQRLLMLVQKSGAAQRWKITPYFNAEQSAKHPELLQLHSIFVDRDGAIWMGCGAALCRVMNNGVAVFGEQQGVPPGPVIAIYRDRHGWLWIRSAHHICVLAEGDQRFRNRDISPASASVYIGAGLLSFAEDAAGNVLTELNTGIARWEGNHWQIFDHTNGVNFDSISTILCDQQGSMWFGTRGHGLFRWRGYDSVENWTTAQGLKNAIVWSIFRDNKKHVWIADQEQVSKLDEATHRFIKVLQPQKFPFVQGDGISQAPDGAVWMVNVSGHVLRFDSATGRTTEQAKLPDTARSFMDASHRIWYNTREGLYVTQNPVAHASAEKVKDALVSSDAFDDATQGPHGDLWFVSDSHLYRLSGEQWSEISIDQRLRHGQLRTVAVAPDGTLWVGGGLPSLLHLQVYGSDTKMLESLTPPTIVSTDIQFARYDQRGWLWIGTDVGVNVFDGKHWRLLTQRDGMISNDCNEGAFFADPDGSVWIGVNGGAVHFLHPERLFQREPLSVLVTSAALGKNSIDLQGRKPSVFQWKDDPLNIDFTSLDYDREGSLQFRYQLAGLEPAWNQTAARQLHYAAMPPGNYRFELLAIDPDGQQASKKVSFAFHIVPPWWRRLPFFIFLVMLSVLVSVFAARWRTRRLIKKQRMLQQLIAQRTSELEAEKAELLIAREALRQQASQDALTGIWNRSAILDILQREMDRAHRERSELAVVLADIDYFKKINDTFGHLAGDAILRDAAQRMLANVRSYDFVGRYGGEEFLIVMPGLSVRGPFLRLVQLQHGISAEPFPYQNESIRVTSSFGVAWMERSTMTVEDMVRCADEALYKAKASGRDRITFYNLTPADESHA